MSLSAAINTSRGEIKITLFSEQTPITVSNFVNLAGRGYYDGLMFHRVIESFTIQGGCPEGTGMGGPGYNFEDECTPELKHDTPGILSMANAGPGTNGSQFFITHVETSWLDGKHTVFGKVDSGQDIVDAIEQGDVIETIKIEGDVQTLLDANRERVDEWNGILDN